MAKIILAMLIAASFLCSACGLFSNNESASGDTEQDAKPGIPFSVKEPETFSANVVVTTNANGKELTSDYFIARSGPSRLEKYSVGREGEFSILVTAGKATYRLFPSKKEYEGLKNSTLYQSTNSLERNMTSRWLNSEKPVSFVDLGNENGLRKYQARIEDSKNTEIIIFVDEKLKYPVKQEVWSVIGEKQDLVFSMELRDISLKPDPSLFVIPSDYKEKRSPEKPYSEKN